MQLKVELLHHLQSLVRVMVMSQDKKLRDRTVLRPLRVLMVIFWYVTELEELTNFQQSLKAETLLLMH